MKLSTARRSAGTPAAGPTVYRVAIPSRMRSSERGGRGAAGCEPAAFVGPRAPAWAGGAGWGGGDPCRFGGRAQAVAGVEAAGEERRLERVQVGGARQGRIVRFELSGGIQQQWRSVAAAPAHERDPGPQASEPRALQ